MRPFSVPWASWFGSGSTTGRNVRDPGRCCKVSSDLTDLPFLTLLPWNRPRNTHVKDALPTPREKEHPSPWRQGKPRSILTGLAKLPPVSCNHLILTYQIPLQLCTWPSPSIQHSRLFLWLFISLWRLWCHIKLILNKSVSLSSHSLGQGNYLQEKDNSAPFLSEKSSKESACHG